MRVVYLNADPGIPLYGSKGSSVHVREMLKALAPQVDRITALSARLTPRGSDSRAAFAQNGVPCPAFSLSPQTESETRKPKSPELHAMALNDAADVALDEIAQRGELDVIYERYSLWSVAGAKAARRWDVPWFVEVNAPLVLEAARHRSLGLRSLASFLERELLAQASGLVVVSNELRDHVVGLGIEADRVSVVPNGYDGALFRPRPSPEPTPRPFTIAFVGSLRPWHGVDDLVEAFSRLHSQRSDCRLLIVGDGPLAEQVRERLERSVPPDAFQLTGAVPHDRVPEWLARADVAVAPYPEQSDFYFSPLKIFEYCAMGLPVVASRIGQVAHVLEDGVSACLTEPGDVDGLVRALARLRDEPDLRERLGRGAREVARHRTWNHVASRVTELFEGALVDPSPRCGVAS